MNFSILRTHGLIVVVFLLVLSGHCLAENDNLCINADLQFDYSMSLHTQKDYKLAQIEFSRFLHFFPDDQRTSQALYTLGLCQFESGDLAQAKESFEQLMNDDSSGNWGIEAYFMTARYHIRTGNPILAEICLRNLIRLTDDTLIKDRAFNTIAWLRLETAQWHHARSLFTQISATGKDHYQVDFLLSALEHTKDIPKKKPKLAGALSIIPGGGYVYCGRYKDALVSFLLNGGLIYAAYESFEREHHALGGVISFVGFGFYAGNIYGSASSAHKYNKSASRSFIRRLKKKVSSPISLGLWQSPGKPPGLAMQIRF